MLKVIFICLICLFSFEYINAQLCSWAYSFSGKNNFGETFIDYIIDKNDNTYLLGVFEQKTLYLNNGVSINKTRNLTTGFVAKFNKEGLCQWASTLVENNDYVMIYSKIGINDNNEIYLTGRSNGNKVIFDNGTIIKSDDTFILKLSPELKILNIDMIRGAEVECITFDNQNNMYIAINKSGSGLIEFNNKKTANKIGYYSDIFIAKYDKNDLCQWVEVIKSGKVDMVKSITIDNNNNLIIAGNFDTSPMTFNNNINLNKRNVKDDIFIAKYDQSGTCLWAKSFGGNYDDKPSRIVVDHKNNIIFTANSTSNYIELSDDYSFNLTPSGGSFIAKIDQDGKELWGKLIATGETFSKIPLDIDGNNFIYCSRIYQFFICYHENGDVNWQFPVSFSIQAILVDSQNNFFISGLLTKAATEKDTVFDFNNGIYLKGESGYSNTFIAKYNVKLNSVNTNNLITDLRLSPNPAKDYITISLKPSECSVVEIYNSLGELVLKDVPHHEDVAHLKRINVSHLPVGLYFVKLGDRVEKFVKM